MNLLFEEDDSRPLLPFLLAFADFDNEVVRGGIAEDTPMSLFSPLPASSLHRSLPLQLVNTNILFT